MYLNTEMCFDCYPKVVEGKWVLSCAYYCLEYVCVLFSIGKEQELIQTFNDNISLINTSLYLVSIGYVCNLPTILFVIVILNN